MTIQPGDFTISLSFSSLSGNIEATLGGEVGLSIIFNNNSSTDSLYNLGLNLELPDGISFVNSSVPENSSIIDSNFKNIVEFINIKDLYPTELGYKVDITLKSEEYFRSEPELAVDFFTVISGLKFSATADTMPRGNLDAGNTIISTAQTSSFKIFRYAVSFIGPTKYLKGAGELIEPPSLAQEQFNYEIILSNNTLESSTVDVNIELANGIRYIGDFVATGTDATKFQVPNISLPADSGNNNTTMSFPSKTLSPGSQTKLSFKGAIWNQYSALGIENSGSEILHGDTLDSTVEVYSDEYGLAYSSCSMSALILFITKTLASAITDWNVVNNFVIGYTPTSYMGINAIQLTNIIPDGMTFLTSAPLPTSTQLNPDGSTALYWDVGDISSSGSGTITFSTTTNESYQNLDTIYSTDIFVSQLNASFIHPVFGSSLIDSISKSLYISAPIITKELIDYYYSDLSVKPLDVATVEDFVKFKIIYDATSIIAPQKDAMLFDYPPLNMLVTSIPTYTTNGDFPAGVIPELVDNNGILLDLGNLSGGNYFEVEYTLEVTEISKSSNLNNLAKLNITNVNDKSTSIRDIAVVYFGGPNLKLTQSITGPDCTSFNGNYYYKLKLKNTSDAKHLNVSEVFNVILTMDTPDIFTITNIAIDGIATYTPPVTVGDITTFNIQNLPSEEILTLDIDIRVSTPPLMSEVYKIKSDITGGTAQSNTNSTEYTELAKNLNKKLTACSPTIIKSFSSSTIDLGEQFTVTSIVEIPSGVLAYNVNISDTLISDNSINFNNLKLNEVPADYTIIGEQLTVPIADTLNTSSGKKTYTLTYENRLESIDSVENEETRFSSSYINWTDETGANHENENDVASLNILEPEITVELFQRNYTQSTTFTKSDLKATLNNSILYKLKVSNIGKSPAYDISIKDILDSDLKFIRLLAGNATFNTSTNTITLSHETLNDGYYVEMLFETLVQNTSETVIALNETLTTYKSNPDVGVHKVISSNQTHLLNEIFIVEKTQKNITLGTDFSIATLPVVNGQTFQYKVSIQNSNSSILNNIQINDTFPQGIEFVSFEPFSNGTLSQDGHDITIDIPSIALDELIEVIYTLKLNTDTLKVDSSSALATFELPGESKSYSFESNTIYTRFSTLGRGFKIY